VLSRLMESITHRVHWNAAHSHNVDLHERLDSSRLLDPPDA
jgi:DNA-binding ferritin-like protein